MIEVHEMQEGLDESFPVVHRRFRQLVAASNAEAIFKIGLTNWPNRRKYGHRFPKWVGDPDFLSEFGLDPEDFAQSQPWAEMRVIFESNSLQGVREVESKLILECIETSSYLGRTCWNLVRGGGGPKSKPGPDGTYYVYVLLG